MEKDLQSKARELRNEYHRKWRQNNKAKVAEINRRYWEKKAAEELKKES